MQTKVNFEHIWDSVYDTFIVLYDKNQPTGTLIIAAILLGEAAKKVDKDKVYTWKFGV
jgi:hypothetical protein